MAARSRIPKAYATVLAPHLRRAFFTEAQARRGQSKGLHIPVPAVSTGAPNLRAPTPSFPTPTAPKPAILAPVCAAAVHSLSGVLTPAHVAASHGPAPPVHSFSAFHHKAPFNLPFSARSVHTATDSPPKEGKEGVREAGTMAAPQADLPQTPTGNQASSPRPTGDGAGGQYWRISGQKLYREDGTEWPWHCFTPTDAYIANTKINLEKSYKPGNFGDTFAKYLVKSLRIPTDIFFQRRYGCRAMMLETVAAVPGMVAGMLLHLKSLRLIEHSGGWIKALLEEAENERMHLMTFMEVAQPKWYERALIFSVQAVFFTFYTAAYVVSPRIAHRIVGYLEEEAVHSYTEFLKDIDAGKIENVPAPQIAIDYWRLPQDARLRDVVEVVRADEAHHRDVNHFAADVVQAGKKLKDNPAPMDYH